MAGEHSAPVTLLQRWADAQPVRLYLYGLTVPVLGLCLAYGWVTQERVGPWLAVAGALFLASAGGTELARRTAWAPRSVDRALDEADRRGFSDGLREAAQQQAVEGVQPATAQMASLGRCRHVEDGNRCVLPAHPGAVVHAYE